MLSETIGAGVNPIPDSATVCGEPAALSETLTEAEREPLPVGVKVTLIAQFPRGSTEAPQLLLCEKSPAFVPVIEMLEIVSARLPGFESTVESGAECTVRAVLGKVSEVGLNTMAAFPVPVPLTKTVCGEPVAVSVIVRFEEKFPVVGGVKVMPNTHDALTASEAPQVLLASAKADGLGELNATFEMEKVAVPMFFIVTLVVAEVVFTA